MAKLKSHPYLQKCEIGCLGLFFEPSSWEALFPEIQKNQRAKLLQNTNSWPENIELEIAQLSSKWETC